MVDGCLVIGLGCRCRDFFMHLMKLYEIGFLWVGFLVVT